jgi:hypothetical protein
MTGVNKDRNEIFICDCHSKEHMAIVSLYDWDGGPPDFYLEITAEHHLPWYRRIWVAVKYIFAQPSLSWHDIILKPEDVARLASVIDDYNAMMAALKTAEEDANND